jgi:hypothetical protein
VDADSYNDAHADAELIQVSFDFTICLRWKLQKRRPRAFSANGPELQGWRLPTSALALGGPPASFRPWRLPWPWRRTWPPAGVPAPPPRDIHDGFGELAGVPRAFGVASHTGFPSGRLTSSNEGTWVPFHHDSSAAPQTVQTASPVCGSKNFVSVRLYSAPQLHRTLSPFLEYAPQAAGIKRLPAWTGQPAGLVFRDARGAGVPGRA